MDAELLAAFDRRIAEAGYGNRSAALADLVADYLAGIDARDPDQAVSATVTILFDHRARQLEDRLVQLQHEAHHLVLCSTHVHLDEHECLEVIVLRGTVREVRQVAERLIGARGVRHGKLVLSPDPST